MCGIAGIVSFNRPVQVDILEAANRKMAHRGPDDAGVWRDDAHRVGFAQRRLSIVDLSSAGHQPMVWRENGVDVAINFNGEIYNCRELRAKCDEASVRQRGTAIAWRGHSDTEVLLWLYMLLGPNMLGMLDGMFALAIWDGRRREMLVARDRFGVKPLYYVRNERHFAFASELKALDALVRVDRDLDSVAVAQYITFLYTPGERTMLRAVRKLSGGQALVITTQGIKSDYEFAKPPMRERPDAKMPAKAAVEGVRTLLQEAVGRQMVADVPIGAFLSGGLDSSSIVALAQRYVGSRRLQCFTIGYSGGGQKADGLVNDLPYAERVARHLGVDLHTVQVGPEMAAQFPWMIAQLDEPQADPAALNAYFICKLAREHGMKVLLSGAGGDDLFSGYRRHRALGLEPHWSWLPQRVRALLSFASQQISPRGAAGRRIAKAFRYAGSDPTDRLVNYFMWLDSAEIAQLWSKDLGAQVATAAIAEPMYAEIGKMPEGAQALSQMLLLDSRFFLIDHNLNYTDKMSMAASVEVRVPFMDNALADFAARIPAKHKQHGAVGKWVLKAAMAGVLPADIIHRPKTGFGVPLRSWMKNEMRVVLDDALSASTLQRRALFDPAAVSRLRERDRQGRIDATYPILALACVELWCRKFIDGN